MRLANGIVLEKDPTFGELKFSALRREVRIQNEDGTVSDEINEFLTTFFKLYPTSTMSELSYYVNEGILKTIGKDYIFQELVNPIYNRKDNQVTVSLSVKYLDQQIKATQVSQFNLTLEKSSSNWKIIK
ncbi:conjugal transfer protein [uncultured Granulicatella sp.]|uniref:conjugal transfer protein n=1 Tax=uncultured Granulicatella sp. TaxID=316089 RepID=UPI00263906EA|nr:conjugal transfer protein [uncultured Granulicatella sp.]